MEVEIRVGPETQHAEILRLLHDLNHKVNEMSETVTTELANLQADVAALTTVVGSATTLIDGFAAQLSAAVTAAEASGATPEQLQGFADLDSALKAQTAVLAAAVAAGTTPAPAAPAVPAEPAPASVDPGAPTA